MTAEHERLLALATPLRALGWVFLRTTLAAPTPQRTVDALFGLRTFGDLEDNVQIWEGWATASRLRKCGRHEEQVWHCAGRIDRVIQELVQLPE
ncbi:hypothetical protein [Actinophytocola oryzae]|uniref:hypothetical protein n=1 Tax=Actinophytocola oryzae TaxID=502181 RepID=UPI00106345C3|nr:hypothetical protein [Actinophytocola oryzae]